MPTFNQLVRKGRQTAVKKSTAPALQKGYNSLKKRYVKEFNEDYLINIDNLEKKLNNSIKSMKDKEEKYIEKNNYYTRREKELLDKIAKLEKENKSLKNQIKKDEPLKQEVVKLRNFVFG